MVSKRLNRRRIVVHLWQTRGRGGREWLVRPMGIGEARWGRAQMTQRVAVVFWTVAAVAWLFAGWFATHLPY